MERQTRHRILGMIVVIALVIIVLPFVQANKEIPAQTALITPPPFPTLAANDAVTEPFVEPALPKPPIMENVESNASHIKHSSYRIIEEGSLNSLFKKPPHEDRHTHVQSLMVLKTPSQKLLQTETTDDGLLKLKSTVWVVQIGSYKDKTNALRIVNQLRSSGYRAFIQDASTAFEDTTRVYVGPERKRTNALALADRLQNEMKVKGIIVSYKPLAL